MDNFPSVPILWSNLKIIVLNFSFETLVEFCAKAISPGMFWVWRHLVTASMTMGLINLFKLLFWSWLVVLYFQKISIFKVFSSLVEYRFLKYVHIILLISSVLVISYFVFNFVNFNIFFLHFFLIYPIVCQFVDFL